MVAFCNYLRGEGRASGCWLDEDSGLRIYAY